MNEIRVALAEKDDGSERGSPDVFVGREAEIRRVMSVAKRLPPDGPPGKTLLIEGAPGVGKTAMIEEVARRLPELGLMPLVLTGVPDEADAQSAFWGIAQALYEVEPADARITKTRGREFFLNLNIFKGRRAEQQVEAPPRLTSAWQTQNLFGSNGAKPKGSVLVFVDEVQNVRPNTPGAKFLFDLHTQQHLPVLLVCAGLSDSTEALDDAGISRLGAGNRIVLDALSSPEALECARRTLDGTLSQFGLPSSEVALDEWAQTLAKASDGWPVHLHNYLRGAWIALSRADDPSLETVAPKEAVREGDRLRDDYYQARLKASKMPTRVVGEIFRKIGGGRRVNESDAKDRIKEIFRKLPTDDEARGAYSNGADCLNGLLHAGVLTIDRDHWVVPPIPTFEDYVLSRCRTDPEWDPTPTD